MKNYKCKLGLHRYKTIGTQYARNIVGGFSMVQLMRVVKKCEICGKIHFDGCDISTNAHLDKTIDWYPKLKF